MTQLPKLIAGYTRKFLRCKQRGCNRVFYYDYVPYSLSNPVYVQPCGHNIGTREKIFAVGITEKEFFQALAPQQPKITKGVILALGAVRAAADIELDSAGDLDRTRRAQLTRGIKYIDELRKWYDGRKKS